MPTIDIEVSFSELNRYEQEDMIEEILRHERELLKKVYEKMKHRDNTYILGEMDKLYFKEPDPEEDFYDLLNYLFGIKICSVEDELRIKEYLEDYK